MKADDDRREAALWKEHLERKNLRNFVIEECARVAESFNPMRRPVYPSRIAAAIRALKQLKIS